MADYHEQNGNARSPRTSAQAHRASSGKTSRSCTSTRSTARRPAPTAPQEREERELHVCEQCESDLVYPTEWEEADERHWQVALRCPNCEHRESGIFSQDECDRFDDHLEAGTEALTRDFKRLMAANMAEEIDRSWRLSTPTPFTRWTSRALRVALDDAVGDELEQSGLALW